MEIQTFLDALENWLSLSEFSLEMIQSKLEEKAKLLLKEHGNSGFNIAAK